MSGTGWEAGLSWYRPPTVKRVESKKLKEDGENSFLSLEELEEMRLILDLFSLVAVFPVALHATIHV